MNSVGMVGGLLDPGLASGRVVERVEPGYAVGSRRHSRATKPQAHVGSGEVVSVLSLGPVVGAQAWIALVVVVVR